MNKKTAIRSAATLLLATICLSVQAEPVSVLGPLESVSADGRSITVLGQTYTIDQAGVYRAASSSVGPLESRFLLPVGTFVSVQGERNAVGAQVASSVRAFRSRYIPGATDVYIQGVAAIYDATVAIAELGSLRVYLGDIEGPVTLGLASGALFEMVGKQSQPGGFVWASAIRIVRPASVAGVDSVTGTGTSIQSVTGTGVSAQSVTGTGASIQSVTGTGASIQSVTGTGVSAQSVTGTGASIQSVTGTGASIQSVTGTGVSAQSVTGTGASAQSVTGTGASFQSVGDRSECAKRHRNWQEHPERHWHGSQHAKHYRDRSECAKRHRNWQEHPERHWHGSQHSKASPGPE